MNVPILSCPFDGEAAALKLDYGDERRNIEVWVECSCCGAKGKRVEGPSTYGYNPKWHQCTVSQAQAVAVAWWNRRA